MQTKDVLSIQLWRVVKTAPLSPAVIAGYSCKSAKVLDLNTCVFVGVAVMQTLKLRTRISI